MNPKEVKEKHDEKVNSLEVLNYWLFRLSPLLIDGNKKRYFLCSDRVGRE